MQTTLNAVRKTKKIIKRKLGWIKKKRCKIMNKKMEVSLKKRQIK